MTITRENSVLIISDQISDVHYVDGSFRITDGQPSSLPPFRAHPEGSDKWLFRFDCGRQGSSSMATNFNDLAGSPNHSWTAPYTEAPRVSTQAPDELNFYFALDITFRNVSAIQRVYFGQGHALAMFNNWWIGGPQILNTYPAYSMLAYFYIDTDHIYRISSPDDASPAFQFDVNV